MPERQREALCFVFVALALSVLVTRGLVVQPTTTDAYYHFNAANRLVSGEGLSDPYLWMYIGAPVELPAPSHLYWMPLTSLSAAFGMALLNAPGDYAAAQWPFTLMLAGTACVGFWLGGRIGGERRQVWLAGLLTIFSGYFVRFWGATDTFAPFALAGSLCLVALGVGLERQHCRWFALAGALAGLGHLARADGLLLLGVGWLILLWPGDKLTLSTRLAGITALTLAYLIVMLPWFVRNLQVANTPLPIGGTQSIWFSEYNDLFSYPVDASPATLFANGAGRFIASRWEALLNNLGTFVAVEGLVVLAPLMLIALWRRRNASFLRPFWLYALFLHVTMTLIFAYPGYRGGLFHSASALVPWWSALGVAGLDDMIGWIAARRQHWNAGLAKGIFSLALLALAVALSLGLVWRGAKDMPTVYQTLVQQLPANTRVMSRNPAEVYYYTGFWGVPLPNEPSETIREIARRYDITYLILESEHIDGQTVPIVTTPLQPLWDTPCEALPDFLTCVPFNVPGTKLYAIHF